MQQMVKKNHRKKWRKQSLKRLNMLDRERVNIEREPADKPTTRAGEGQGEQAEDEGIDHDAEACIRYASSEFANPDIIPQDGCVKYGKGQALNENKSFQRDYHCGGIVVKWNVTTFVSNHHKMEIATTKSRANKTTDEICSEINEFTLLHPEQHTCPLFSEDDLLPLVATYHRSSRFEEWWLLSPATYREQHAATKPRRPTCDKGLFLRPARRHGLHQQNNCLRGYSSDRQLVTADGHRILEQLPTEMLVGFRDFTTSL